MDFNKLQSLNQGKLDKQANEEDKASKDLATIRTQEVFVKSIQLLTEFMQGHTTRTVVVNQIKGFATSEDIDKTTQVLDALHETLKTHENTDVSPVVDVLNEVVSQLEQIPKENQEYPEFPEQKDYSKQLDRFVTVADSIVEAINAQETVVEAPVVNVEAPNVKVDAPDLKPLAKDLDKAFKAAIKLIKPAKPTDLKPVVAEQKKTTKSIDKLYKLMHDNPFGGGGSGGGAGAVKAFDANGVLQNITAVESTTTPGVWGLVVLTSTGADISGGSSTPSSVYGTGTYGTATYS